MGLTFDWTLRASDIIAGLAFLIAALGYRHSVRTRREQLASNQPTITLTGIERVFADREDEETSSGFRVTLRSRDNDSYLCTHARIVSPQSARLVRPRTAEKLGAIERGRSVPLRIRVAQAGTKTERTLGGIPIRQGDTDHDFVIVSVPPSIWPWARRSSRRVIISFSISRESDSKSSTVRKVIRIVPTKTAPASSNSES